MQDKKMVTIDLAEVDSKDMLLALLAEELAFPSYFGKNFSALADCLGDINVPTTITIIGLSDESPSWATKAAGIIRRIADKNRWLECKEY